MVLIKVSHLPSKVFYPYKSSDLMGTGIITGKKMPVGTVRDSTVPADILAIGAGDRSWRQ